MFIDTNPVFEISEVLKERRAAVGFKTKKRHISFISCRTEGGAVFYTDGSSITAKEGDILFIPQQSEYSQRTDGETVITVHLKLYSDITEKIELVTLKSRERAVRYFEDIYNEWTAKLPGYRQRAAAVLYSLIADIKSEKSFSKDNSYSKIVASVTYMKSHFYLPELQIAEIAAKSNISEIYFRKIWEKYFNLTPAQYITKLRIDYARELLLGSDCLVREIAERAGFPNEKYFSARFKAITGITPSEYRKNIRE